MKKEYKLLLLASLVCNFADNIIGPFYALWAKDVVGSITLLGFSSFTFSLTLGVLTILTGKLSDKWNKEVVTIIGYLIYSLGTLGYIFTSKPWHLFALQVVFAIGAACLAAPLSALFADFIDKKNSGFLWGLSSGGTRIALAFAILCGTFIIKYFGFMTIFLIMFVLQLAATLLQVRFYMLKRNASRATI